MKKHLLLLSIIALLLFGFMHQSFSQMITSSVEKNAYINPGLKVVKSIYKNNSLYQAYSHPNSATSFFRQQMFITKDGVKIFDKSSDNTGGTEITDMIVDSVGNVYFVGNTTGSLLFKPNSTVVHGSFLVKINASGVVQYGVSASLNKVTSLAFSSSDNLIVYGDAPNLNQTAAVPTIIALNKNTAAKVAINGFISPYQIASGTATAGKVFQSSDLSLTYFTVNFSSGSVKLSPTTSSYANAGGNDVLLVDYNSVTKGINNIYHLGTAKNEYINDVAFSLSGLQSIFAIGTNNVVGSTDKDAFILREVRPPASQRSYYTIPLANNLDNEGVSITYSDRLYAVYKTKGSHTIGNTTITNRTDYSDIMVVGYTVHSSDGSTMSYSNHIRLMANDFVTGSIAVVSPTDYIISGSLAGAELNATDITGTKQILSSYYNYYFGFDVRVSTAPCPSVSTPQSIVGSSNVCAGNSTSYYVPPVEGASSYTWTKPNGWTGVTTGNAISLIPTSTPGAITVKANNACGNSSAAVSKTVSIGGAPSIPATIQGPVAICPNKTQVYSIDSVSGATSYVWTLPNGWSGTSTGTSITVTSVANAGNITVASKNSCGTSATRSLTISTNGAGPAQPSTIIGDLQVCKGSHQVYSVAQVQGVDTYEWILPSGVVGSSVTNTIEVEITDNAISGNITVFPLNSCGYGNSRSAALVVQSTVPAQPSEISGAAAACPGLSTGFSVTQVSGVSYIWKVSDPSYNILEYSPNNGIQLTVGNKTAEVNVVAVNACGLSIERTKEVYVALPGKPVIVGVSNLLCVGDLSSSYANVSSSVSSSYEWEYSDNITATPTTSNFISFKANNLGVNNTASIAVRGKNSCGLGEYLFIELPVNIKPAKPSPIVGTVSPMQNVTYPYSVLPVEAATSYNWFSNGAIISGSTNEVDITFPTGGNSISVSAENNCGISESSFLSINVVQDLTSPTISSLSPVNNATEVEINSDLVLTFSEPVQKIGNKLIQIVNGATNGVFLTYTTDSPEVNLTENTLTINPSIDLENNTTYYVYIAQASFKDASNNFFNGLYNSSFWSFTTKASNSALKVVSISPASGSTVASVDPTFVITFNKEIKKHTSGLFVMYDELDNTLGARWSSLSMFTIQPDGKSILVVYPAGYTSLGQIVRYELSQGIADMEGNIWEGFTDYRLKIGTITDIENSTSDFASAIPNPFTSTCSLALPKGTVTIFDSKGQNIQEFESDGNTKHSIGEEWNTGLYLITISTENDTQLIRVIKE